MPKQIVIFADWRDHRTFMSLGSFLVDCNHQVIYTWTLGDLIKALKLDKFNFLLIHEGLIEKKAGNLFLCSRDGQEIIPPELTDEDKGLPLLTFLKKFGYQVPIVTLGLYAKNGKIDPTDGVIGSCGTFPRDYKRILELIETVIGLRSVDAP